jgi:hypothetical protein
MIDIKLQPDPASFQPRMMLSLNGKAFASLNIEILDDLTFISPNGNPFKGPELSLDGAIEELSAMIKNEYTDILSEVPIQELVRAFQYIVKNYKVKKWNGEYLKFQ